MQRNIQAIHVTMSCEKTSIVDAVTRNNHFMKISGVHLKRKVDVRQKRNVTDI